MSRLRVGSFCIFLYKNCILVTLSPYVEMFLEGTPSFHTCLLTTKIFLSSSSIISLTSSFSFQRNSVPSRLKSGGLSGSYLHAEQ